MRRFHENIKNIFYIQQVATMEPMEPMEPYEIQGRETIAGDETLNASNPRQETHLLDAGKVAKP
jgi:hypothetical protein